MRGRAIQASFQEPVPCDARQHYPFPITPVPNRVEQSPCPAEAPTHCVAVFSCSLASAFSPNPGSTFEGVAASRSLLDVQGCGLAVLLLTAVRALP